VRLFATILVVITCIGSFAQKKDSIENAVNRVKMAEGKVDSVERKLGALASNGKSSMDSASRAVAMHANFIRSKFQSGADSLHRIYQKPINKLDSVNRCLRAGTDSVRKLGRAGRKVLTVYKHKLDSVSRAKTRKLSEMNTRVEQLKSKTSARLHQLDLPPELKGPVRDMEKSIGRYSVPMVNGKIPNVSLGGPSIPGVQIPGVNLNLNTNLSGLKTNLPANTNLPGNVSGLPNMTGKINGYEGNANRLVNQEVNQIKNVDKTLEQKALDAPGMSELKTKNKELDKYKKKMKERPDSAALKLVKEQAMQQITKEATDHMAGQEAVINYAMSRMSKLKRRYDNVKSVMELPKKLPNPLHDTPFIERIIPLLTLQVYTSSLVLTDLNPGVMYRISPRFSAGPGWVERIAWEHKPGAEQRHVYGPRIIGQFNWGKGICLRLVPEVLNTYLPPQFNQNVTGDPNGRHWIMGIVAGLKKEFTIYKAIKGNSEIMYNFTQATLASPYPDRLIMRFGFEFHMKKKEK
jgi:outer membrane murein-binding lipoprotein Lpp